MRSQDTQQTGIMKRNKSSNVCECLNQLDLDTAPVLGAPVDILAENLVLMLLSRGSQTVR